jgi:hypothetical protein
VPDTPPTKITNRPPASEDDYEHDMYNITGHDIESNREGNVPAVFAVMSPYPMVSMVTTTNQSESSKEIGIHPSDRS